jgi:hypothetical protein
LDYKQFKSRAKQEANIIMNLNTLESQGAGGGRVLTLRVWKSKEFIPNI